MDANACWARLVTALEEGDAGEAAEAAEDLALWIEKGGTVPRGLGAAIVATSPADDVNLCKLQRALGY